MIGKIPREVGSLNIDKKRLLKSHPFEKLAFSHCNVLVPVRWFFRRFFVPRMRTQYFRTYASWNTCRLRFFSVRVLEENSKSTLVAPYSPYKPHKCSWRTLNEPIFHSTLKHCFFAPIRWGVYRRQWAHRYTNYPPWKRCGQFLSLHGQCL